MFHYTQDSVMVAINGVEYIPQAKVRRGERKTMREGGTKREENETPVVT